MYNLWLITVWQTASWNIFSREYNAFIFQVNSSTQLCQSPINRKLPNFCNVHCKRNIPLRNYAFQFKKRNSVKSKLEDDKTAMRLTDREIRNRVKSWWISGIPKMHFYKWCGISVKSARCSWGTHVFRALSRKIAIINRSIPSSNRRRHSLISLPTFALKWRSRDAQWNRGEWSKGRRNGEGCRRGLRVVRTHLWMNALFWGVQFRSRVSSVRCSPAFPGCRHARDLDRVNDRAIEHAYAIPAWLCR